MLNRLGHTQAVSDDVLSGMRWALLQTLWIRPIVPHALPIVCFTKTTLPLRVWPACSIRACSASRNCSYYAPGSARMPMPSKFCEQTHLVTQTDHATDLLVDGKEQEKRRHWLRHHREHVLVQAVHVRVRPLFADTELVRKLGTTTPQTAASDAPAMRALLLTSTPIEDMLLFPSMAARPAQPFPHSSSLCAFSCLATRRTLFITCKPAIPIPPPLP